MPSIKKVLIYALRTRTEPEVLVFDHVKYPEVSPQLPAGTVEAQEATEDYYFENGLIVFTRAYHLKRGHCCNSGCRHCPYRSINRSSTSG